MKHRVAAVPITIVVLPLIVVYCCISRVHEERVTPHSILWSNYHISKGRELLRALSLGAAAVVWHNMALVDGCADAMGQQEANRER